MISRRSAVIGAVAGAVLVAVFVGVLAGTAGWSHLGQQVREDGWLLAPLVAGFAVQVALMVELRYRHRMMRSAAVSMSSGAGTSTVGMVACCAHHVADLVPLAGATGVAAFLTGVQRPLMAAGIAVNAVAIAIGVRRLRGTPSAAAAQAGQPDRSGAGATCAR